MPYIKQEDRWKFDTLPIPANAGEIQYAIAFLAKLYMQSQGTSYQACNDVMGALAGAQLEFYRRTVAPYEEKKIKENGDV